MRDAEQEKKGFSEKDEGPQMKATKRHDITSERTLRADRKHGRHWNGHLA